MSLSKNTDQQIIEEAERTLRRLASSQEEQQSIDMHSIALCLLVIARNSVKVELSSTQSAALPSIKIKPDKK